MYVRIARFEGAEREVIDRQLDAIRQQMAEGRERLASGEAQGEEAEGMRAIKRTIVAVDRQAGRTAAVMFADTEDDIRKIDTWLNSMSPGSGGGQRTSAEIYEVAIDEQA